MQDLKVNRDEEIRQLAYRLWQEEGCPDGRHLQHWLKAETILLEENRQPSEPKESKPAKGRKGRQIRAAERQL